MPTTFRYHLLTESKKVEFLANQFNAKLVAAFMADPKINLTKAEAKELMPKPIVDPDAPAKDDDGPHHREHKFEPPVALVKKLQEADPSGERGDFLQFIVRMYTLHEFRFEDLGRIKQELENFVKFKNKLQPTEAVKNPKDLNSYKTLKQLYDMVETVADDVNDEDLKSRKQKEKEAKIEGADIIIDDPNLRVVKLKTAKAARLYCAGTKWCTSDDRTYEMYAKQDDLYVILAVLNGKHRKFQLHYRSNQIMDEQDRRFNKEDKTALSRLPGDPWRKFLEILINKYYELDNK